MASLLANRDARARNETAHSLDIGDAHCIEPSHQQERGNTDMLQICPSIPVSKCTGDYEFIGPLHRVVHFRAEMAEHACQWFRNRIYSAQVLGVDLLEHGI